MYLQVCKTLKTLTTVSMSITFTKFEMLTATTDEPELQLEELQIPQDSSVTAPSACAPPSGQVKVPAL